MFNKQNAIKVVDKFLMELESILINKNISLSISGEAKSKIFLIGKEFVLSMYRDQSNQKLFKRLSSDVKDVKDQYPKKLETKTALAKGLYETAKYMLHHPD